MTFKQMDGQEQPTTAERIAYATLKALGRKMGFAEWWGNMTPDRREVIFQDVVEVIKPLVNRET